MSYTNIEPLKRKALEEATTPSNKRKKIDILELSLEKLPALKAFIKHVGTLGSKVKWQEIFNGFNMDEIKLDIIASAYIVVENADLPNACIEKILEVTTGTLHFLIIKQLTSLNQAKKVTPAFPNLDYEFVRLAMPTWDHAEESTHCMLTTTMKNDKEKTIVRLKGAYSVSDKIPLPEVPLPEDFVKTRREALLRANENLNENPQTQSRQKLINPPVSKKKTSINQPAAKISVKDNITSANLPPLQSQEVFPYWVTPNYSVPELPICNPQARFQETAKNKPLQPPRNVGLSIFQQPQAPLKLPLEQLPALKAFIQHVSKLKSKPNQQKIFNGFNLDEIKLDIIASSYIVEKNPDLPNACIKKILEVTLGTCHFLIIKQLSSLIQATKVTLTKPNLDYEFVRLAMPTLKHMENSTDRMQTTTMQNDKQRTIDRLTPAYSVLSIIPSPEDFVKTRREALLSASENLQIQSKQKLINHPVSKKKTSNNLPTAQMPKQANITNFSLPPIQSPKAFPCWVTPNYAVPELPVYDSQAPFQEAAKNEHLQPTRNFKRSIFQQPQASVVPQEKNAPIEGSKESSFSNLTEIEKESILGSYDEQFEQEYFSGLSTLNDNESFFNVS
jgi:hypothetical protein